MNQAIAEKLLAIMDVVLRRLLDPDQIQKAYELNLVKRKQKALEVAEQHFLHAEMKLSRVHQRLGEIKYSVDSQSEIDKKELVNSLGDLMDDVRDASKQLGKEKDRFFDHNN